MHRYDNSDLSPEALRGFARQPGAPGQIVPPQLSALELALHALRGSKLAVITPLSFVFFCVTFDTWQPEITHQESLSDQRCVKKCGALAAPGRVCRRSRARSSSHSKLAASCHAGHKAERHAEHITSVQCQTPSIQNGYRLSEAANA